MNQKGCNMDLNECNDKLKVLLNAQQSLEEKISQLETKKQRLVTQYVVKKYGVNNSNLILCKELGNIIGNKNGLSKLNKDFRDLYDKSFYYLSSRRNNTGIKPNDILGNYRYRSKELLFNTRGLKYTDGYSSYIYDIGMNDVVNILKKHHKELRRYVIKKRIDVYDNFVKLVKKWKIFDSSTLGKIENDCNFKHIVKSRLDYTKLENIREDNLDYMTVGIDRLEIYIKLYKGGKVTWSSDYTLRIPFSEEDLTEIDYNIICQLPDEVIDKLKEYKEGFNKILTNNSKALNKYMKAVSPYLLARDL
jgi:hypothetical protein